MRLPVVSLSSLCKGTTTTTTPFRIVRRHLSSTRTTTTLVAPFWHVKQTLRLSYQQQQQQQPYQQPYQQQRWYSKSIPNAAVVTTNNDGSPLEEEEEPRPLILFLDSDDNNYEDASSSLIQQQRPPLLWNLPSIQPDPSVVVQTIPDALDCIHQRYSQATSFVGGMGENDPGVVVVPNNNSDVLDHAEFLVELIQQVRQQRHGIPYALYTTGIVTHQSDQMVVPWELLEELPRGSVTWYLSLYAATPQEYKQAIHDIVSNNTNTVDDDNNTVDNHASQQWFGQACDFCVQAVERGMTVEALVTENHATAGRQLALALGAQNVHTTNQYLG